ncbi:MAG: hypothetical protein M3141_02495, partial [Actinomycetota bacterium]|nr:hypothetical protein [Actinomycetota bacterium]
MFDSDEARKQADDIGYRDSGVVPPSVDFFALSFFASDSGLAGGAGCVQRDDPDLEGCVRVPVIYRFERPRPGEPAVWSEVYRGSEPGYVGALGWVNARKAVAVGGDGCYPRRESKWRCGRDGANAKAQPDDPNRLDEREEKIAGDARAWVLENRRWSEVRDLPARMTGLTALAFSQAPKAVCNAETECGFAGGLGQVWTWKDGAFREGLPTNKLSDWRMAAAAGSGRPPVSDPLFRVRALTATPGSTNGVDRKAVAVTAGCCYADTATGLLDPQVNGPRVLTLQNGSWNVAGPGGSVPPRAQVLTDSFYAVAQRAAGTRTDCLALVASAGGPPFDGPGGEVRDAASSVEGAEPVSRVVRRCRGLIGTGLVSEGRAADVSSGPEYTEDYPELGSVWLAAADADVATHQDGILEKSGVTRGPLGLVGNGVQSGQGGTGSHTGDTRLTDGLFDWAVGHLRDSGAVGARRAVAFTTMARAYGVDAPFPLDCPSEGVASVSLSGEVSARCTPAGADAIVRQTVSDHVMSLPSYALNAMAPVGASGVSWA